MKPRHLFFLVILILITMFLRFYQLDKLPGGLNIDESSEGYNAFSLLNTGKDRYGEFFPILFRSFGSFQAPLYTYFSLIPVFVFGNTIFSMHFISAICGIFLVIISFVLFRNNINLGLSVGILVCISPWNILFSRYGTEAILGVTLFALSVLFYYFGLKKGLYFIPAFIFLGLSTHAYYSEKIISVLFLMAFCILFKKNILKQRKFFLIGFLLFIIILIPHLLISGTGAFTRRANQVGYFSDEFFQNNSGVLKDILFGKTIFVIREFLSHYFAYFSPKNLFFDPDPQLGRSIPNLSVFYTWMVIPFIFGWSFLIRNYKSDLNKIILTVILISLIPASLTREPFYTLRTLVFLWAMTLVIGLGTREILSQITIPKVRWSLIFIVFIFSMFQLYVSYFILFKYERSEHFGYGSLQLLQKVSKIKDQKVIIDTSNRDLGIGVRFAYFTNYDPRKLQNTLSQKIKGNYYSDIEYYEDYKINNLEIRPIVWEEDIYRDEILVSDNLAISNNQVKEHFLEAIFEVKDIAGNIVYTGYKTNPKLKCASEKKPVREECLY